MRKNSSIPPASDGEPAPGGPGERAPREVDLASWGFEFDRGDDLWMERLRAAEAPLALGRIGPYELLEEVSRGGQGVVFRARQPGTKRVIALKRMLAGSFSSDSTRRRFEREVESAASLSHPGLVTVYGMEQVDGQPLLAMEWVEGVPLTDWAREQRDAGPAGTIAILELFLRLCSAVAHAHARGVLHRDLKPSNVLVDAEDQPRVLDFGLATYFDPERAEQARVTRTSAFVGTPAYSSPEQLRADGTRLDERADVYSLGVLLHEALTGAGPHGEWSGVVDLLRRIERGSPTRPSSIVPTLAGELDTIVLEALAAEREERYDSVEALAADLRRYLAGEPIRAVPVSSLALLRRVLLRHPATAGLAAALLLTGAGFAGYAWRQAGVVSAKNTALEEALEDAREQNAKYEGLLKFVPDCEQQAASTNPNYVELNRPALDPARIPPID